MFLQLVLQVPKVSFYSAYPAIANVSGSNIHVVAETKPIFYKPTGKDSNNQRSGGPWGAKCMPPDSNACGIWR